MVSKEQVFAVELQTETVDVPDLGPLTVRELTQDEYADWVAEWATQEGGTIKTDNKRYCAGLLLRTVMRGQEQMFTPEDLPRLTRLPARISRPLLQAAERLNGLTTTAMRDAEKNSAGGQDG